MKKIKIKHHKTFFTICILILCVLSFLYYDLIFRTSYAKDEFSNQVEKIAEQNENPIFKIQKILIYSSANAIDKSENESLQDLSILQYSDIAITLDNTSTVYDLTNENTIKELYIDSSGNICLDKPENVANINVSCYTLRDIRGGELQTYSIVKVGGQYWLGEDLRASRYSKSDVSLALIAQLGYAGYLKNKNCYFYTGEALLAGELAPYGWRIPARQDWDRLVNYVGQDVSRLKAGTWKGFTDSDMVSPVTNDTGLGVFPNGLYIFDGEGNTAHYNWQTTAAYWIGGDEPCTLTEESIMMKGNSNEVSFGGNHPKGEECYAGLAIRCIKK